MKMDKKDILIIICLFCIAFLIRVVGVQNVSAYWDEWIYWDYTGRVLANNFAPTLYVFHSASPFLSYIGAAVTLLYGGDLSTLRVISVIFGSLTVPFLYLFGKSMYDRKTGLLAALFLCFSAYHGLFSRVIMLEAFALFFVTAFLYFFWQSQQSEGRNGIKYSIISGVMLGLAVAAKYLPIFLVPSIFIYIFWTRKFDLRALLDKRLILMSIFAFLTFLPMLLIWYSTGADPIYEYSYVIPNSRSAVLSRGIDTDPTLLFITAAQQITEIFSWDAGRLIKPMNTVFVLSVVFLILMTFFSYVIKLINIEKEGSFLLISIFNLFILIIFFIVGKYYLIYSFPFWFVMISHFAIESFEHFQNEKNYKNIFSFFVILFVVIMFISYLITGVTAPFFGLTEQSWVDKAIAFIKNDTIRSNYEGKIVIGRVAFRDNIEYAIYFNKLNASSRAIEKPGGKSIYAETVELDIEKINTLKPNYLIFSESQYNYFFYKSNNKEIFKNYTNIFHSETYLIRRGHAYAGYVLKRNVQEEFSQMTEHKVGEISKDMFNKSVPSAMKVGKAYPIIVRVKNTGNFSANFTVRIESDKFIITGDFGVRALDTGSTYTYILKIVPLMEHIGAIPITAHIYVGDELKEIDSVTDYVYLIK